MSRSLISLIMYTIIHSAVISVIHCECELFGWMSVMSWPLANCSYSFNYKDVELNDDLVNLPGFMSIFILCLKHEFFTEAMSREQWREEREKRAQMKRDAKKDRLKKLFDSEYDEKDGEGGGNMFDSLKAEMDQQAQVLIFQSK